MPLTQMPVEMWTYVAMSDDVPTALRMLADRLEETGQALLGLQSTGFGEPWEAVIQVFVDPDRDDADGSATVTDQPSTTAAPRRCWWRGHKWTRWELRSMSVENGWGDMVTGDRNERRCLRCGVVKRRKP